MFRSVADLWRYIATQVWRTGGLPKGNRYGI